MIQRALQDLEAIKVTTRCVATILFVVVVESRVVAKSILWFVAIFACARSRGKVLLADPSIALTCAICYMQAAMDRVFYFLCGEPDK